MVSLTPELEHIPTAHFAPEASELGYMYLETTVIGTLFKDSVVHAKMY